MQRLNTSKDYIKLAEEAEQLNKSYDAIAHYTKAIELNPQATTFRKRAVVYSEIRNFDAAIKDLTLAMEKDSNNAEIFNERGILFMKKISLDEAIADFTKAIELNSTFSEVFFNRGRVYFEKEQLTLALADLDQALAINPHSDIYYFLRGLIYMAEEQWSEAKLDLDSAILSNSAYAIAYHNRGIVHLKLNDYESAIEDFSKAIEFESDKILQARSYNLRAYIYYEKSYAKKDRQLADKAKCDYMKALQLGLEDKEALIELGMMFYMLSDFEQAAHKFSRAINLSKNPSFILYFNRAQCYLKLGLYESAIEDLIKTLTLKENCWGAYLDLAKAYVETQEADKAIAACNQLIKFIPNCYDAYFARAKIFFSEKQYDKAIADLTFAIWLDNKKSNAYSLRASVFEAMKDYVAAFNDYRCLTTLYPNEILYKEKHNLCKFELTLFSKNKMIMPTLGESPTFKRNK